MASFSTELESNGYSCPKSPTLFDMLFMLLKLVGRNVDVFSCGLDGRERIGSSSPPREERLGVKKPFNGETSVSWLEDPIQSPLGACSK